MSEIGKRVDQIISLGLAPAMRREHFRKKQHTFYREHEHCVEVLNVQASRWNQGESGQFTINLGVYIPAVAEITGAIQFKGLPKEYQCTVRKRIGSLLPIRSDHWWKIEPSTNLESMASEIVATVEKYALPWFHKMGDMNQIKEEVKNEHRVFVAAGIALLQGDKQQARECLLLALKQQPPAAEEIKSWGVKHKLIEA